jgi:hypothetical protein
MRCRISSFVQNPQYANKHANPGIQSQNPSEKPKASSSTGTNPKTKLHLVIQSHFSLLAAFATRVTRQISPMSPIHTLLPFGMRLFGLPVFSSGSTFGLVACFPSLRSGEGIRLLYLLHICRYRM